MDFTHLLLLSALASLIVTQALSVAYLARTLKQIEKTGNATTLLVHATLATSQATLQQLKK